ncbi:MAG: cellulose synthase catalytic subunit (UDP-forming), partial [Rhodobacterales bacterium]|nr:cellulose synthase catalytic subunit (UDP-forming) [Rhodobacterales bacterium]
MSKRFPNGRTRNRTVFLLWLLSGIPIAVLVSVPTSTAGQAFLGLVAVVVVALLKPFSRHMVTRFFLLATATVIVMRYWLWRLLETIPEPAISVAFLVAVLLFLVET